MEKAVAYLRVSGESQLDGGGFDRQKDNCEKFAITQKLELVQVFQEEAVSGTKDETERPAFKAMVAWMIDNEVETAIIEGLDRLARMMRIQEQLLLYLCSKNLTLYAANTGENITAAIQSDPMKKALIQMQGVFAELDRSMIVAKLKRGRQIKAAKLGKREVCGQKGFGHYKGEAEVLERIRELRKDRLYFDQIAAQLTIEGLPTRSGRPWSPVVIAKILRREAKVTAPVEK